jgi:protein associated with RNAse G/E
MTETPTPLTIRSSKYDGSFHYEYSAELIENIIDEELGRVWKCLIKQDSLIQSYRGTLEARSNTTGYFFEQQWFNLLIPEIPIGRRQRVDTSSYAPRGR